MIVPSSLSFKHWVLGTLWVSAGLALGVAGGSVWWACQWVQHHQGTTLNLTHVFRKHGQAWASQALGVPLQVQGLSVYWPKAFTTPQGTTQWEPFTLRLQGVRLEQAPHWHLSLAAAELRLNPNKLAQLKEAAITHVQLEGLQVSVRNEDGLNALQAKLKQWFPPPATPQPPFSWKGQTQLALHYGQLRYGADTVKDLTIVANLASNPQLANSFSSAGQIKAQLQRLGQQTPMSLQWALQPTAQAPLPTTPTAWQSLQALLPWQVLHLHVGPLPLGLLKPWLPTNATLHQWPSSSSINARRNGAKEVYKGV